jgi:hypothetical protein
MAKQSFISHVVNGYSRYDVPESKAFTCTPGILYPVRIDFINARDRVTIAQGIDVRSNPLAVPSFNPYTVRLHRFWVPMQLYHPEMRTNSSKFDMNAVSLNWLSATTSVRATGAFSDAAFSNSLMFWLRIGNKSFLRGTSGDLGAVDLPSSLSVGQWANADTYLAYWDIVRNYYSFSQWSLYSFAWPASWGINFETSSAGEYTFDWFYNTKSSFFTQRYGNLEYLDSYFESQFYPSSVDTSNNTFQRSNLFLQILASDLQSQVASTGAAGNGFPVFPVSSYDNVTISGAAPTSQISNTPGSATGGSMQSIFRCAHPMAVVPSNPDRFSRLLPSGVSEAVSMSGVSTIPQLAIASRLQEYKDLLGAGGNRFSDWLETFFASKIDHVDRPKLLFSASQTVNVQVVMNQAGSNNFTPSGSGSNDITSPLGQQGGAIAFNTQLGRSQSYYFREPGYLIDMLSIRPVYYWCSVTPDYLNYQGPDYFNPIYNDIGYQDDSYIMLLNPNVINGAVNGVLAREPCFNEFRSSYDEVLGQISAISGPTDNKPLYSYWVQQRMVTSFTGTNTADRYYPMLFVDMSQVNSSFASDVEDNFFVNMSYSVRKKNLVNKTFATRLSNR